MVLGTMLLVLVGASSSHAHDIWFEPWSQEVVIGTPVDVAIAIDTGEGSEAVSVFDLDVLFDPTILAPNAVVFGDSVLGDQLDLFGLGSIIDATQGVGVMNLAELSLDSPDDLEALQADFFTLATVTFDTLAFGTSTLEISVNALGDAFGNPLRAYVGDGSVGAVPEPRACVLFGTGLIVVGIGLRRSAARR